LHTALVKLLEELLRYVAAIAEEFAKELFGHSSLTDADHGR
jgi:hypothetical protein